MEQLFPFSVTDSDVQTCAYNSMWSLENRKWPVKPTRGSAPSMLMTELWKGPLKKCALPCMSWQCNQNIQCSFKACFSICIPSVPHSENSNEPPNLFPFLIFGLDLHWASLGFRESFQRPQYLLWRSGYPVPPKDTLRKCSVCFSFLTNSPNSVLFGLQKVFSSCTRANNVFRFRECR